MNDAQRPPGGEPYGWPSERPPADEAYRWRATPASAPRAPRRRWRLAVYLFLGTVASTFVANYIWSVDVGRALGYSAAIMSILLLHEMGHFLMCLRYGVPATPPYFIPLPLPPFGTLGAVILMPPRQRSLRSILDIGAAGPLAGLVVAIPVAYLGLKLSTVVDAGELELEGGIRLGDSILFWLISRVALGDLPATGEIILHPVALAGWAGLFLTGLNLLPIGQLDGGHIVYALLGRRARYVGWAFFGLFALWTALVHHGWWLMLLLLLLVLRRGHPPALDPRPLGRGRVAVGVLLLIIFVLTFVPRPLVLLEP